MQEEKLKGKRNTWKDYNNLLVEHLKDKIID